MGLRAQGLLGRGPKRPADVLRQIAGVQLDTISVLARSHELVCYARAGAVGRAAVEAACWGRDRSGWPVAFEYWAHAACVLPIEMWPLFAFRRRKLASHPRWGGYVDHNPAVAEVLRRLETEGPLTSSELGGAKNGGPWWDWSPVKVAVERLLDLGEVICTTRRGWRRVYDLSARALPRVVPACPELADDQCFAALTAIAGRSIGVGTVPDLAEYFRLPVAAVAAAAPESGLVPVTVAGWGSSGGTISAWADPVALEALGMRGRHRTTLLSPFDSMVWDRPRTARLFGFTHRIEAYTPAAQRVHGYYVMPVLAGGHIIGRVDPKRMGKTLVVRQVSVRLPVRERDVVAVAQALREAAGWTGCDEVVVERSDPEALGPALTAALTAAVPVSA
jgi:uncharacterized protein YcaQ